MAKPKITIYTTKTCAFCHALKQYLEGHKVEYDEVRVDETPDGPQKLIDASGQMGVPVTDFDGTIVVGYNRPQIDMLLREHKLI
jgi:glutaredoxin